MAGIAHNRLELALLLIIAVVCAGLSVLQYRWTGEVSRAEGVRLRSALDEQAGRFVRAFEDEIRDNYRALTPDASEVRELGWQEAHRLRHEQWKSTHDPSLFRRVAIARPFRGAIELYGFDSPLEVSRMSWPTTWEPLHSTFRAWMEGGHLPSVSRESTLIELPVFGHAGSERGQREIVNWMVFEVSEEYLVHQLIPGLVAEYFNPSSEAVYDVSVTWTDGRKPPLFSSRTDQSSVESGADLTTRFFSTRVVDAGGRRRGHERDEAAAGRRRGRGGDDVATSRFILAIRHREGSLDAAVASARVLNLVTSLVLILLLGGAAAALVRYTGRSRRLAEMQFRFAVGVSHDLRTPLTAIRGAAFNLVDGVIKEPAAVAQYGKLILRNAEELTSMIENVLAFAATQKGDREDRLEAFDVGELLEHAVASMSQEIEQAGCCIDVTLAPDLPAVNGDPMALECAVRNLISNAVKHAGSGRWIGLSAMRSGSAVEVRVSDRGPGIPEPERVRIFEPFFRGERARAAQVRGTGLGLSLVKETVERCGGTFNVENSVGGGAHFIVRLPEAPGAK